VPFGTYYYEEDLGEGGFSFPTAYAVKPTPEDMEADQETFYAYWMLLGLYTILPISLVAWNVKRMKRGIQLGKCYEEPNAHKPEMATQGKPSD
jgi:hypothetical protein